MNIIDIITKKKNKLELTKEELEFAFNGYLNKQIPDYQMSSLLMAITLNGMTLDETVNLTEIFINSGETYDLSSIDKTVDKHSTGGVGDSVTLALGPICAALDLHMAKMSGRGLGFTGGTIDKLESIPEFNVNLTKEGFINQVKTIGFALSAQTENLCPMDKVIYALRDVTGTTESIPLIASSIMSKKIASGAQNILIDVKYGNGALMKTPEDAKILADWLENIGSRHNRNVKTILSNMNTPLSYAIGNALEVQEVMEVLKGKSCPLYDTVVEEASILYSMATGESKEQAKFKVIDVINTKKASMKFFQFVMAQHGQLGQLKVSTNKLALRAKEDGVVEKIDALGAAKLACKLGASKMTLDDKIDFSVGLYLHVKEGDHVKTGDVLVDLYCKENEKPELGDADFEFISVVSEI